MEKMNENTETQENFATEVFYAFQRQSRFVTVALIILLPISSSVWAFAYYWNNHEWRELFASYDYVYQDSEGINNVNIGTQGDLTNIPDEE